MQRCHGKDKDSGQSGSCCSVLDAGTPIGIFHIVFFTLDMLKSQWLRSCTPRLSSSLLPPICEIYSASNPKVVLLKGSR